MIQVENLTRTYGDICAVDRINLEIRKGEILGLLGPNGAGKTTTMRMLTGFLRPTAGTVQVKNIDIAQDPIAIKKIMGYLPESAPLYHDMLVYDYLEYVAAIRSIDPGRSAARIRELVELCGLNGVMHQPIGELSKGYKQRVGLAHAMMNDPEILVLDEPTSGLDPNQIVEIRDIIRQIGKEKTVILSTHILSEAEATCDRVVIISQGKIVADGDLQSLKLSAGDRFLIHLTLRGADEDTARKAFASVAGVHEVTVAPAGSDMLTVRLSGAADQDLREPLYRTVKQTDWILLEFYQEARNLESIFRELTKEN
jgi:ABC-2 type transport system ATP-binding protein